MCEKALPANAAEAWDDRRGPLILSTVSPDGDVNAIYVTCVKKYDDSRLVMADNYFNKTRANIKAGSRGSLLYMDKGSVAYQVKGRIEYQTSGEIYDDMKNGWLKPVFKGVAAVVLHVEEVYRCSVDLKHPAGGAERIL